MRALVLSTTFPNARQPNLGIFIAERMRRVARACDVVVVAPVPWFPFNEAIRGARWNAVPPVEEFDGVRVLHPRIFCIPGLFKWTDGVLYAASLVPFLSRLRKEFDFDLIDSHFVYPDGLAAVLLGKIFHRPVVVTLRGSIVRLANYPLHRPQIRWALRKATRIVSVSVALRNVAAELGIPPARIQIIPNGVDAERFQPRDRAAARRACGLPLDRRIVLTVGGLYEHKGQHLVLQVLPELVRRYPNVLYVMVGDPVQPRDKDRLLEMIRRGDLEDHVVFAGSRLNRVLGDWYAASDVFCLPTRSEGWANVLLESLACGTPVVTTRVGGNPEIVSDERYGYLVPFQDAPALRDALVRALDTSWDRHAIARYARAHTWEGAADRVRAEFEQVLAAKPAAAAVPASLGGDAR